MNFTVSKTKGVPDGAWPFSFSWWSHDFQNILHYHLNDYRASSRTAGQESIIFRRYFYYVIIFLRLSIMKLLWNMKFLWLFVAHFLSDWLQSHWQDDWTRKHNFSKIFSLCGKFLWLIINCEIVIKLSYAKSEVPRIFLAKQEISEAYTNVPGKLRGDYFNSM